MPNLAKILASVLTGLTLAAAALLAGMTRRVRRRGGFGPRAGIWLRVLTPAILGLGGWSLGVLAVSILWPGAYLGDPLVTVPPIGAAVGYGVSCAWTRRDRTPRHRRRSLAAAPAAALAGAWLGSSAAEGLAAAPTAIIGPRSPPTSPSSPSTSSATARARSVRSRFGRASPRRDRDQPVTRLRPGR